jgi:hypothetical protein
VGGHQPAGDHHGVDRWRQADRREGWVDLWGGLAGRVDGKGALGLRCTPPQSADCLPTTTRNLLSAAMSALGLDIVDFVTVGIECTLRQLLEAGFFHAGGLTGRSGEQAAGAAESFVRRRCRRPSTSQCAHIHSPPPHPPLPPPCLPGAPPPDPHPGNLLATTSGDLVYLDFGMMSEAPASGGCQGTVPASCCTCWPPVPTAPPPHAPRHRPSRIPPLHLPTRSPAPACSALRHHRTCRSPREPRLPGQ